MSNKKSHNKSTYNSSSTAYVSKVQMLRSSGASGIHKSTKPKSHAKRTAIRIHMDSF